MYCQCMDIVNINISQFRIDFIPPISILRVCKTQRQTPLAIAIPP